MTAIARGTPPWLVVLWLVPLLARSGAGRTATVGAALACTAFFRDPERRPDGPGIVASADGLVRSVELDDGRWSVSVYLSLRDVHVTRAPCAGSLTGAEYRRGSHRPAFHPSSHRNERLEWQLATEHGDVRLVQFAGTLARRIVPYLRPGDSFVRGARIGLIRFGSRVDVRLPAGFFPTVEQGGRVRAGRTVIAVAGR